MRSTVFLQFFFSATLISAKQLQCRPRPGGAPVPLGVFVSKSGPGREVPDVIPAIGVALDHIQNHCVLDGFQLEAIFKDTGCTTSLGMRALFELMSARPRPVAIFGGMCTEVNEPTAMALKYWQIVQLSYAETHAKFASADSQELYPTFYRVVPGDRNLNNAKCRLIQHFGWRKVGTIKQSDDPRFSLPHESLTAKLEHGYGIRVVYTAGVAAHELDNIGAELEHLKIRDFLQSLDVRILIADVSEEIAIQVICEAYRRHMYGDNYVWILPGFHSTQWMHSGGSTCSFSELSQVLEGHFATEFALSRKDKQSEVVSGKSAAEVWNELQSVDPSKNVWKGYLYDGLWALALALSSSLEPNGNISNVARFISSINNSSFEGVTGKVRFENNERLGLVDIKRFVGGSFKQIGYFDGALDRFQIDPEQLEGWQAPRDATIVERHREHVEMTILVVMSFLAGVGILLSLIFLFVNVKNRNHRFIKMSSPNLNNIIIVGSMCTFASVILLGLDTRFLSDDGFVRLCYVKSWTLCLGFTLSFGSMFSKTWRVHSIFTNIRMDRKAIKDSKLLLILAGLLFIDVIVLTFWALFSPFRFSVTELPKIIMENRMIVPEVEGCHSDKSAYFQAVLYAIKGVLMILGCFLAWETRRVNVPALNDSKYIGMSVYGVVVMSTLGLSISVILQERVNEAFALTSFFIICSTTLTLCLVFVPKLIELVRNPQGMEPRGYRRGLMKSVVSKNSSNIQQANNIPKDADRELLAKAESENQIRRRYLHQKSTQLWDLLDKLRERGDTQFLQQEWCFTTSSGGGAGLDSGGDVDCCRRDTSAEVSLLSNGQPADWPWADPDESSTML